MQADAVLTLHTKLISHTSTHTEPLMLTSARFVSRPAGRGDRSAFQSVLSVLSHQRYFSEKHKKEWRVIVCALGVCHLES